MTSTHGIILAAIGLGMFAIMAVMYGRKPFAWYRLWRQKRAKWLADMDAARQDFANACAEAGVSRLAAALTCSLVELDDPDAMRARAREIRASIRPRPGTPYASKITGTGSRPEAPWVTREEVCSKGADHERATSIAIHNRDFHRNFEAIGEVQEAIRALGKHLGPIKGLSLREAQVLNLCRLCGKPPSLPLKLDFGREYACQKCLDDAALESKRAGEGVRVFSNATKTPSYNGAYLRLWDGKKMWALELETDKWCPDPHGVEHIAGLYTELAPTDERFAGVVESWRDRESNNR